MRGEGSAAHSDAAYDFDAVKRRREAEYQALLSRRRGPERRTKLESPFWPREERVSLRMNEVGLDAKAQNLFGVLKLLARGEPQLRARYDEILPHAGMKLTELKASMRRLEAHHVIKRQRQSIKGGSQGLAWCWTTTFLPEESWIVGPAMIASPEEQSVGASSWVDASSQERPLADRSSAKTGRGTTEEGSEISGRGAAPTLDNVDRADYRTPADAVNEPSAPTTRAQRLAAPVGIRMSADADAHELATALGMRLPIAWWCKDRRRWQMTLELPERRGMRRRTTVRGMTEEETRLNFIERSLAARGLMAHRQLRLAIADNH